MGSVGQFFDFVATSSSRYWKIFRQLTGGFPQRTDEFRVRFLDQFFDFWELLVEGLICLVVACWVFLWGKENTGSVIPIKLSLWKNMGKILVWSGYKQDMKAYMLRNLLYCWVPYYLVEQFRHLQIFTNNIFHILATEKLKSQLFFSL